MLADGAHRSLARGHRCPFRIGNMIEHVVTMQNFQLGINLCLRYTAHHIGWTGPLGSNDNILSSVLYEKFHFRQVLFSRKQRD